jgi:hypothetical protein
LNMNNNDIVDAKNISAVNLSTTNGTLGKKTQLELQFGV